MLAFDQLSIELKAVQPLAQVVQLGRVEWTQPHLSLQRNRAGVLNWQALFEPPGGPGEAINSVAAGASDTRTTDQNGINPVTKPVTKPVAASWKLGVDQLVLKGGQVM